MLSEVIVTGSRLAYSGYAAPTPVTVVDAGVIARQAAPNISDVLNQLPSFSAVTTTATSSIDTSNAGANLADLRGLGANRTLVLVNGRRLVAGTIAGGNPYSPPGAVDLNMIPASMIDRVEVVTGGASAVYGSDAVAGVVNLILDDRLEGLRGSAQYGESQRGDGKDYTASLAGGTKFADGRGHIIVGGEYDDQGAVGGCLTRPACAQQYSPVSNPNPGANGLPATLLLPNTRSSRASYSGLITSGPLAGQEFANNGQSLFTHNYGTNYGAGIFQSGGSADGANPFLINYPLVTPVTRYALLAELNYDFSNSLSGFLEVSYGGSHATSVGGQVRDLGDITIQSDNAYLPASVVNQMAAAGVTSFNMGRIGQDIGPESGETRRSTTRIAAGLKGSLGSRWSWDAYYQYGETDYHQSTANDRINANFFNALDAVRSPSGAIVCRSTLTSPNNGCVPLDLFGQYNYSAAAIAYSFGTATQDTTLREQVVAATIHGDLLTLPAGPVSTAAGIEYRSDEVHGTADPISLALGFNNNGGQAISGPAIDVTEGFGEINVPLLRDVQFAKDLELNGAARVTNYSTSGTVWTWKVGGVWQPLEPVRFRATRSRDIRAPNAFELYSTQSSGNQFLTDPKFNNAGQLVNVINGGNPNLLPEVADTTTAGVVLAPARNFQVSIDYYGISLANAISTLGAQTIVDGCYSGATALCADVTRNSAGQIVSVQDINLNVQNITEHGVDIEASYTRPLPLGRVSLHATATHVIDFVTSDLNGSINRAGMNGVPPSSLPGLPRWMINSSAGWQYEHFSAQLQVRFISAGVYNVAQIGPGQAGYSPSLPNSISDNHIPAYFYLNLNAQYDIIKDSSHKLEVFGAIDNLLDKQPPAQFPSSFANGNPILYDPIGRAFRMGVRFSY